MTATVDCRRLACPKPVIEVRKAMRQADQVVALVDNETSLTNISHMAEKAGWQVRVVPEGDQSRIELTRGVPVQAVGPEPMRVGRAEAVSGPLVVTVSGDRMGRGESELGRILIRSFFHALGEAQPQPDVIIFFNTGVKLACQDSTVLDELRALESHGVELLACGTCLAFFDLKEKLAVGSISNMYDIAEAMLGAGKVVSL